MAVSRIVFSTPTEIIERELNECIENEEIEKLEKLEKKVKSDFEETENKRKQLNKLLALALILPAGYYFYSEVLERNQKM